MNQNSFNLLTAIVEIISLISTIIGLLVVYIQLKKIQETTWSNTHSKLADQSFELLKFFSSTPSTYDYFYNKKKLEDEAPDKIIILYAAEALANFMEHLVFQKNNLPKEQWKVWERFIYITFGSSLVIRDFINNNKEWYSSELLAIAKEFKLNNDDEPNKKEKTK